ncbi:hypothetical protein ES703_116414 [subsurface metagenome]
MSLVLMRRTRISYATMPKIHQMTYCPLGAINIIRNNRRAARATDTINNHIRQIDPLHNFDGLLGTLLEHNYPIHFPGWQLSVVLL